MLNGRPVIDVDELRAYCVYQSSSKAFGEAHVTVVWLWKLAREMGVSQRRALLLFFTGSSRIPLDGFDPPLNVTEGADMREDSLPRAHTCFNQLVLPAYSSYQVMRDKILFAIANTNSFEMA